MLSEVILSQYQGSNLGYLTFALLGFLFELHESNAYRNLEMMKVFLREHLPLPERVRKKKISSFEDLLEEMAEIELLIDATEQERRRTKGEIGGETIQGERRGM